MCVSALGGEGEAGPGQRRREALGARVGHQDVVPGGHHQGLVRDTSESAGDGEALQRADAREHGLGPGEMRQGLGLVGRDPLGLRGEPGGRVQEDRLRPHEGFRPAPGQDRPTGREAAARGRVEGVPAVDHHDPPDPPGRGERHLQGDQAAQRVTDDVGAVDPGRVQHGERVPGHGGDIVIRAKPVGRPPGPAVVVGHHPELCRERGHLRCEVPGPAAEPRREQHRRPVLRARHRVVERSRASAHRVLIGRDARRRRSPPARPASRGRTGCSSAPASRPGNTPRRRR